MPIETFQHFSSLTQFLFAITILFCVFILVLSAIVISKIYRRKKMDKKRLENPENDEVYYRNQLLDKIESGQIEKLGVYIEKGFLQNDLAKLDQAKWWIQLDGILALDITFKWLTDPKLKHDILTRITPLIEDRHPLVALSAVKIYFQFCDTLEFEKLLHILEDHEKITEDLIFDTLKENFSLAPKIFYKFGKENPDSSIAKIIAMLIQPEHGSKGDEFIMDLLKHHKFNRNTHLKEFIKSAGRLRLYKIKPTLEKMIPHQDDEIEIALLLALKELDSKTYTLDYLQNLTESQKINNSRIDDVIAYLKANEEG